LPIVVNKFGINLLIKISLRDIINILVVGMSGKEAIQAKYNQIII
jgi:hypothetical protein